MFGIQIQRQVQGYRMAPLATARITQHKSKVDFYFGIVILFVFPFERLVFVALDQTPVAKDCGQPKRVE